MRHRILVLAVMPAAAALLLSACSGSSSPTHKSSSGNATIALSSDPGGLNPLTSATPGADQMVALTYESLLSFPQDKAAVGSLAQSWKITTTTATFTLKKNITCDDGSKLTASDVAATFAFAETPSTASPYKGVYFPASGLKIKPNDSAGTVTFTLPQPESFAAQTLGALPIVCPAGLKNPSAMKTKTFGTGPYRLTSATTGVNYTLTRKSDYTWGAEGVTAKTAGLPQTIKAQVVASSPTRVNLLQSKSVQVAEIDGLDVGRLAGQKFESSYDVDELPGLVFFNQNAARPTHDLAVRQAIAAALDRSALGKTYSSGHGELLTNLVPSYPALCPGQNSASAIPTHNVTRAKQLLQNDGWSVGPGGIRTKNDKQLSVTLLYPAAGTPSGSPQLSAAMELMQQELAAVGIKGTPTASSSFTDVIFQGGNWDIVWAPIGTSLPSNWQGILSGAFPPKGLNWTYNTNQAYFKLAAKAQTLAEAASCKYWTQAQGLLFSDLEVLPISSLPSKVVGSGISFEVSTKGFVLPTTIRTAS